uniref:Glycosyltransferase family 92 protein n=1 Tax=Biomphalaria glabrata TaxID=6526 RepID=A0A2C9KGK9_BIOGL
MYLRNTCRIIFQYRYNTVLLLLVSTVILVHYNYSKLVFVQYVLRNTATIGTNETSTSFDSSTSSWSESSSVWKTWTSPLTDSQSQKNDTNSTLNASFKTTTVLNLLKISSDNLRVTVGPTGIPDKPRFQQVNDHDAWLFSAFFDNFNNTDLIRVFGIQPLLLNTSVFCHLVEGTSSYVIEGTKKDLFDWHRNRRRVFSYECLLNETSRPHNVSLTFNETDTPTNSLLVLYPQALQRNFTVCYSMLYNYNTPYQLVQNVEFNRVLGAEHFFLYRESVSSAVDTVLKHYQRRGFLTVIEWPIPVGEIHYHGQILSLNDCVYRNRGVSRYVVIQDTDEFIIPHQNDNWTELMEVLNKEFELSNKSQSEQLGTYIVQSTFYQQSPNSSEWADITGHFSISDEEFQMFKKFSLTVFSNLKRIKTFFVGGRQKSFVRPETVLFNDIHTPDKNRPCIANVTVSTDVAVVHHHRRWTSSEDYILDTTSLKFKDRVLPLINETILLLTL